ncbi:MAG: TIGR03619 family F420-dependent LLM class oxidoreductase [Acidimicrobiales bacterium]|nr:TIGR03619 family F420-dependent LLM class oxidoreductase [Acidimicrobiales bacterium]
MTGAPLRFGFPFVTLHPAAWLDVAVAADELGFESAWIADHVVFPLELRGQLKPGEDHAPVPPTVPVYDAVAQLCAIAARTSRIGLGAFVYLLGLRHPFVTARAWATLDIVSQGRALVGVGAGWLETEWEAVGLDFSTRGARLDEALEVCRRLWTEPTIEHHGRFYDFAPVAFEPKPVTSPHPPVLVGGETAAAMRRAARWQGWMGMDHTVESAMPLLDELRRACDDAGLERHVEATVMGECGDDAHVERWRAIGVDRLIVSPWTSTRDAIPALERFADRFGVA